MSEKIVVWKRFSDKPLEERISVVRTFQRRYPTMIPVIAHPAPRSKFADIADLRLIVQPHCSIAKFFHTVRRKLELEAEEALFFTIGDIIPPSSATVAAVYEEFKSKDDNFLYITYCEENVYGA